MKFGLSSFVWTSPFTDESMPLIKKAKEMGFDGYEICIEDPSTIDAEKILKESNNHNIDIIICGAFGEERDIGSDNVSYRETGLSYTKICIDTAKKVGAKLVVGPMYSGSGNLKQRTSEEAKTRRLNIIENMKHLADYADERDIKLAIEPLNRFETDLINTVSQGLELIEQIDKKNVGLLLDTFHMNIEEKNIPDSIRLAGSKLFHFHACANDRGTPGEDHFDWKAIKGALGDIDYQGYAVIESFSPDIKEIARSVSLWRNVAESPDILAKNGLAHLKKVL